MADQLVRLSFATIDLLSGGDVADHVDRAVRAALDDLARKPKDRRARKVTLTVSLTPSAGGRAGAGVVVAVKLPDGKSDTVGRIDVKARKDGAPELLFSPASPANPDQQTLDFGEGR